LRGYGYFLLGISKNLWSEREKRERKKLPSAPQKT
jgi:hypothetical protein